MKFIHPTSIRFRDLDALGHVNNAVYLSYIEEARIAYFRAVIGKEHDWKKQGLVLVNNTINYHAPIFLHDIVTCSVACTKIGTTSMSFDFELHILGGDTPVKCVSGSTVLVCRDHDLQTSTPVPTDWRKAFIRYEPALS